MGYFFLIDPRPCYIVSGRCINRNRQNLILKIIYDTEVYIAVISVEAEDFTSIVQLEIVYINLGHFALHRAGTSITTSCTVKTWFSLFTGLSKFAPRLQWCYPSELSDTHWGRSFKVPAEQPLTHSFLRSGLMALWRSSFRPLTQIKLQEGRPRPLSVGTRGFWATQCLKWGNGETAGAFLVFISSPSFSPSSSSFQYCSNSTGSRIFFWEEKRFSASNFLCKLSISSRIRVLSS